MELGSLTIDENLGFEGVGEYSLERDDVDWCPLLTSFWATLWVIDQIMWPRRTRNRGRERVEVRNGEWLELGPREQRRTVR
jgi:hypothetical protein